MPARQWMAMLFPCFALSSSESMNAFKPPSESGNDLSSIGKERNSIVDSFRHFGSSERRDSCFSASGECGDYYIHSRTPGRCNIVF